MKNPRISKALALLSAFAWAFVGANAQTSPQVVTDDLTYNVGSPVKIKVVFPDQTTAPQVPLDLAATIHFAGEHKALVAGRLFAAGVSVPRGTRSTPYRELWRIPRDSRTGRYEVDLVARNAKTHKIAYDLHGAAFFGVHRKLLRIQRIELDRTFYTPGDPVSVRMTLKNLSGRPLTGLRVEFSKRYWPWIAPSSEQAGVEAFPLAQALNLPAQGSRELASARAAVAPEVEKPSAFQYAVVVWDRKRKNVFDIAFSPLVFISPHGVEYPKPYSATLGSSLEYLYPDLTSVDVTHYRHFYPPELDSPAIEFDRAHTMWVAGSEGRISFSIHNPTAEVWQGVSIRVHWLDPENHEVSSVVLAESLDLAPGSAALKQTASLRFPAGARGIYKAKVEVAGRSGEVLQTNFLELGVNPLPNSILIFCAHEDDEGAHSGVIRAAVENHIPIHFVYFTGGDAGSCDRYYQHSCDPAEALNFGELRMEEARAALGHLGVPREDIYFLGLPDGGSGEIWSNHRESSNPYLSVLLASDHSPYPDVARPNLPFARQSVVEAAKEFIRKFQPQVIYTGHPDERHVDHRTNNWFVVEALQELRHEGLLSPEPVLLVDQVYGPGPQKHAPYQYQKHILYVSGEARALAQQAQWFYQSQDGNRARGNLKTYEKLPRTETHWQILDWKDHEGWNELP